MAGTTRFWCIPLPRLLTYFNHPEALQFLPTMGYVSPKSTSTVNLLSGTETGVYGSSNIGHISISQSLFDCIVVHGPDKRSSSPSEQSNSEGVEEEEKKQA